MTYQREDLCTVVGLAFEHLMQSEAKAKTLKQKEKLAKQLASFNKTIYGLHITFEELPLEIHAKTHRFLDGGLRKDGKGIKGPDVGPPNA